MNEQPLNPYESPQEELQKISSDEDEVSKGLVKDLKYFIGSFALLLVLTALMLDGGWMFHYFKIAALAQILLVLMVLYRIKQRGKAKTMVDVFMIRWGILPLFAITLILKNTILR